MCVYRASGLRSCLWEASWGPRDARESGEGGVVLCVPCACITKEKRETGREKEVASSLETLQTTQTELVKSHTVNPALETTVTSSLLLDWGPIS